jgi:hypothetical protein
MESNLSAMLKLIYPLIKKIYILKKLIEIRVEEKDATCCWAGKQKTLESVAGQGNSKPTC